MQKPGISLKLLSNKALFIEKDPVSKNAENQTRHGWLINHGAEKNNSCW
jgi:hypothetical protein